MYDVMKCSSRRTWEKPQHTSASVSSVNTNHSKTKPAIIIIIVVKLLIIIITCKDLQCLPSV